MRIGVQLPEVEREVRWPEYAEMARAAEEVGFESLWSGDHMLYRGDRGERGPWDCWTLLAGLAAVTEKVLLGPLVACTGYRAPGMLARAAAAVDELSGGRLILGVGCGWNDLEFRALGLPYDRKVSRFEEAFEIIRRLLDGEHVTYEGRFYETDDAVLLPPPARRVPLMVGGIGPRLLAASLPHVDAWNTWWDDTCNRADGFAELNARIDEACELAGRDPKEVERSTCVLVEIDGGAGERRALPEAPPLPLDQLAAELRGYQQAGADEVILVLDPITEESIRAVADVGLRPPS